MWSVPSQDQVDWLTEALKDLIHRRGAEEFLSTPLVLPGPRHFPDRWRLEAECIAAITERLMRYAGLDALRASIQYFEPADESPTLTAEAARFRSDAAATYQGIADGQCHFGVNLATLTDPEHFVAAMAHEVSHAWRDFHQVVVDNREEEELLTDLTETYLGFGVLSANSAYRFSQSGEQHGAYAVTMRSHQALGYLPPDARCYLLAAHAMLCYPNETRTVARWLLPNQAKSFQECVKCIDLDELIEKLDLPAPASWPVARSLPGVD